MKKTLILATDRGSKSAREIITIQYNILLILPKGFSELIYNMTTDLNYDNIHFLK